MDTSRRIDARGLAVETGRQRTWVHDLEPLLAEERAQGRFRGDPERSETVAPASFDCHAELTSDGERSPHRHVDLALGSTRAMAMFDCHASILSAGHCPHPPHTHPEEELLVMLEGSPELEVVFADGSSQRQRVEPGTVAYYPAWQAHTIHNPGHGTATYLMYHWRGAGRRTADQLATGVFPATRPAAPDGAGRAMTLLFEGPTAYLGRLRCHLSALRPAGGHAAERHAHDLGVVVLSGDLESAGKRLGPGSVVFVPAGEPHSMRNVGSDSARYLVLELEAASGLTAVRNTQSALVRAFLQRATALMPRRLIERAPRRIRELVRRLAR